MTLSHHLHFSDSPGKSSSTEQTGIPLSLPASSTITDFYRDGDDASLMTIRDASTEREEKTRQGSQPTDEGIVPPGTEFDLGFLEQRDHKFGRKWSSKEAIMCLFFCIYT